jgi:hypothetical protein
LIERSPTADAVDHATAQRTLDYELRRTRFGTARDEHKRRWNRVGNARLVAFAAAIALLLLGLQVGSWIGYSAALICAIAFVVLVVVHRSIGRRLRHASALHDINLESRLRCERDWKALPLRHEFTVPAGHPYANDLDLFGHASLFHLLETVETPMGAERLRDWLLAPSTTEEALARQAFVRELGPELEWRQELEARGRLIGGSPPSPEPLLAWCESDHSVVGRPILRLLALAGPLALFASLAAVAFGWIPLAVTIAIGIVNLIVSQTLAGGAKVQIALVADQFPSISQYSRLLQQIESAPGDSALARRTRERLGMGEHLASGLLAGLGRRAAFAVPPGSALYFPLQAIFAWDVNVLARLEAWRGVAGGHVRDWLAAIGDVEALAAFAGLAHDQPAWVMPAIEPGARVVEATKLGHPLLANDLRVTNDVRVGPAGTVLLVTGSNMSGKSTLLRAIGVNLVLASAGAPVCSAAFSMPPVRLWTSVRVEDSLERGVSFFMAELQRLKAIVDAADERGDGGRVLLFLLDEILQGTNTAERQIAARRVIRHLVDSGAIGAVSTHDLTLGEGPELAEIVDPVHLRDTVTEHGMSFDYKVRPGVATSTNALRLMDIVFGARPKPG